MTYSNKVLPCNKKQGSATDNGRPSGAVVVTAVSVKARKPGGGGNTTRYDAQVSWPGSEPYLLGLAEARRQDAEKAGWDHAQAVLGGVAMSVAEQSVALTATAQLS